MAKFSTLIGMLALSAAASGCATLTGSDQQVVAVQTIQDNREIAGAGCVLSNDEGRWFVTSPGRINIRKSTGELTIDCRKGHASSGNELVASRFGAANLIGNVVVSGGLGYLVDRSTGAGFDYPATLTVIMHKAAEPVQAQAGGVADNVVF